MRRLALKNKRKTLETKEASSNSELDASEENGGSLDSSAGNESSARGSKARKSRAQPEFDTPDTSGKYEEDSVDSNKSANEGTHRGSRAKRGRPSTTGTKTEENGDSLDSSAAVNEGNTRGSKARKSRGQSEVENVDTPNKRKKRDSDDECPGKEAELVIDSRIYRKKKQYKVRWRNYGSDQDTWESPENIDSALIAAYNAQKDSNGSENEGDNIDEPAEVDTKPVPQNDVHEVESILAVRTVKNKRRYKVHWKGLSNDEDSWVSENKLSCPEILQDFLRKQKEKKNLPKPIKVDGDSEEYEVDKVIEVRFKKGGKREFLIRWKGFSSNDDTWEPEENLNCPELITKFMAKVEKAKNSTSRELRTNPVMTERLTLNMKSAQLRYSRRPQTQNRPTYHNYLV